MSLEEIQGDSRDRRSIAVHSPRRGLYLDYQYQVPGTPVPYYFICICIWRYTAYCHTYPQCHWPTNWELGGTHWDPLDYLYPLLVPVVYLEKGCQGETKIKIPTIVILWHRRSQNYCFLNSNCHLCVRVNSTYCTWYSSTRSTHLMLSSSQTTTVITFSTVYSEYGVIKVVFACRFLHQRSKIKVLVPWYKCTRHRVS